MRNALGWLAVALLAAGCGTGNGGSTSGTTSTSSASASSGVSTTSGTSSSNTTRSSACEALAPPQPTTSAAYSVASGPYGCGPFTSDGAGTLYLGYSDSFGDWHVALVDPNGSVIGDAVAEHVSWLYDFWGQAQGVLADVSAQAAGAALWRIGSDASSSAVGAFGGGMIVSDPTGGSVVFQAAHMGQIDLRAFDSSGAERWSLPMSSAQWSATEVMAVDELGNTLLLWDSEGGAVDGCWIDHAGNRGGDFEVVSANDRAVLAEAGDLALHLAPRVGGGLFLREGKTAHGRWVAQLNSLATNVVRAPTWLADLVNSDLQLIHSGTGYAVQEDPNCDDVVSVFAADGTRCGSYTFSPPEGAVRGCHPAFSIGRDGSLIRPEVIDGASQTCGWRWWPAVFR